MTTNYRILVVEDHKDWAQDIKTCIKSSPSLGASCSVDVVDNCAHAVKMMIEASYNLAVVDIKLPNASEGMCIMGICSNLRRRIPLIIVSGEISREQILESIQDYPIAPEDIMLKHNFNEQLFLERIQLLLTHSDKPKHHETHAINKPSARKKVTFWQALGGGIAALVSVLTAYSIGYNAGKEYQEQPLTTNQVQACANNNEVTVISKAGHKDQRVVLIMRLLNQSGCIVTDIRSVNSTSSNLRYYHKADANEAMLIGTFLKTKAGLNLPVTYIPGQASKKPAGRIEIWLGS